MSEPIFWQAVFGDFETHDGDLIFKGGVLDTPQKAVTKTGMAIGSQRFGGGVLTAHVAYSDPEYAPSVLLVLFRDPQTDFRITAGLGGSDGLGAYQVSLWSPQKGWANVAQYGIAKPEQGKEHVLRIEMRGSRLDIFDRDIHMLRHDVPLAFPSSNVGVFCQARSSVKVSEVRVDPAQKAVFVIMQFSPPYNELYSEVIKPVATHAGLRVERADEIYGPSVIISDIVRKLREADLIIAEVTPENPNVFYEVGFAHALGKPTILIAEQGRALPFDVSPFRTLFYENSIAGKKRIEEGLRMHIDAISRDYSIR